MHLKDVRAGDDLDITIDNVESLTGRYKVDPAGFLSLPYIEPVKVLGLKDNEIGALLTRRYSQGLLVDPKIKVLRANKALGRVIVNGAVNQSRAIDISNYMRLTDIIARAGGLTPTANLNEFVVLRLEGEARKIYGVNYKHILDGTQADPIIGPQDYIYIKNAGETVDIESLKNSLHVLNLALDLAGN